MSAQEGKKSLGQRVTRYAAPKEKRSALRFAIEFPLSEFAEIEAASDEIGQSISEFVRTAVKGYLHPKTSTINLSKSGIERVETWATISEMTDPDIQNGHENTSQSVEAHIAVTFHTL